MAFPSLPPGPLFADQPSAEFWSSPVPTITGALALVVGAVGVAVILWGAYNAVVRLIGSAMAGPREPTPRPYSAPARLLFLSYLLPGLEFLLAAGLIKTLGSPDWQQAAVLVGLVLVRTLLALTLKWEAAPGGLLAEVEPAQTPGRLPAPRDEPPELVHEAARDPAFAPAPDGP
jgi:uncharacterized membrane protein